MALQPVNAFQIGGKAVLHHKVTPKAQDISCIKQRFFLGGDEKLIGGPFEPLCLPILSEDNRGGNLHQSAAAWVLIHAASPVFV